MGREGHEGTHGSLLACVLLCLATLLFGGCGGSSLDGAAASEADAGPPRRGGTIVVAAAKEPPIINSWLAPGAMTITQQLTDGLSDPLVTLDPKGAWIPVLATAVPTLDNGGVVLEDGGGMRVALELQPTAAWSDGTPITCADVRFTWQTVMEPSNQIATRLGWEQIDGIECPTARSVRIHFSTRYAPYLSRILSTAPLPEHALQGRNFNTIWNDRVTVSSGPYVFDSWQRGVRLTLKRNPRYWRSGHEAHADRVVFRFVKDANTLKMQLRMQEADVSFIPADTNLETELRGTPDVHYEVLPGAVMELLVLRTDRAPLDDVRVRQALAHAIDRRMITEVILSGMVPPAPGPMVTTQAPAYQDAPFAKYDKPDPARVTELLTEAGWSRAGDGPWTKGGTPLTLTWVAGAGSMPFRAKVAQLVQEQLRHQGIATDIRLIPTEVLYSHTAPHGQFHLGEWSELTGAEPLPNLIYGCGEIPKKPTFAGKNRAAWCNREAEALMTRADETVDVAQRAALVKQADAIIADEVPVLPLFQSPDVVAWRSRVHGLQLNPMGLHTWNIDEWWVSE
ncbi:MAG: extracellular solute-binding protein family 5 [Thermoleophilia bacterium]|nr:extracellular solute-binding protein family 5 [Thermoleophilia bacterium]